MRFLRSIVAVVVAAAAGFAPEPRGALAAEPADPRMWVERASLPVPTEVRPNAGRTPSSVRLRIILGVGIADFDPRAGAFAVEAGGASLLRTAPGDGAERWRAKGAVWTWKGRDALGPVRARIDFRLGEGRIRVRAARRDLSPLVAAGPADVRFVLHLGDLAWVRFETIGTKGRTWHAPLTAKDLVGGTPPPPRDGLLPQGELPAEVIASGSVSGHTGPVLEVIRDAAVWTEFWRLHSGTDETPPAIDFAKDMVVAIVLAERPAPAGDPPFPTLDPPEGIGGSLSLPWIEWLPDAACVAAATRFEDVRPFEFVRVQRSDGTPVFLRSVGSFDCR